MYGRPEREKTRVARGSDFSPVTRGTVQRMQVLVVNLFICLELKCSALLLL